MFGELLNVRASDKNRTESEKMFGQIVRNVRASQTNDRRLYLFLICSGLLFRHFERHMGWKIIEKEK